MGTVRQKSLAIFQITILLRNNPSWFLYPSFSLDSFLYFFFISLSLRIYLFIYFLIPSQNILLNKYVPFIIHKIRPKRTKKPLRSAVCQTMSVSFCNITRNHWFYNAMVRNKNFYPECSNVKHKHWLRKSNKRCEQRYNFTLIAPLLYKRNRFTKRKS